MKIVIGLTEHIGDIIACEPVARYLRRSYPEAHIAWAVLRPYRALIDSNPFIDETLTVECLTDWIKLTKHQSFDKIVDLHVNYRVCSCCRIPLVKETGNPFVNAYEWFDHGALLEAFSFGAGLPKLSAHPNMYLGDAEKASVMKLALPAEYCVIHRESNNVDKDWAAANWQRFGKWVHEELGLEIVEIGASKLDLPSPFAGLATNLINKTSLLETAEVIRRARFFVGVDSGPAHMANALRTPGVVMLGRLNVFRRYMPYTGYYASHEPEVKILQNLNGPARETPLEEVIAAAQYVDNILRERSANAKSPIAGIEYAAGLNEAPVVLEDVGAATHVAERTIVEQSGFFDEAWYTLQYPEAEASGLDPIDHFILIGGAKGFSPSGEFDSRHYLRVHSDVEKAGANPLLHYLSFGKAEGRMIKPFATTAGDDLWTNPQADYEREVSAGYTPRLSVSLESDKSGGAEVSGGATDVGMPRTFAFYLPQFHPIAENNHAHGPGFTEWNNVIKSKPLFDGHYQPRIPGELGYYDLRSLETMREQIRLAVEHGITGFCFYYYYFHGKKLLYKPIENYINSDIEAPFCFLWANENWSKRWDGGNNEVIIAQEHSKEDDLAFIRELVPVFRDRRYVKINGKPVLLVYKTHLFPDILSTTAIWRDEIERHGFPGIYLIMVDDWIPDPVHPRMLGFDASYEIPSNVVPLQVLSSETESLGLDDDFNGRIVDYQKFANFHMSRPFPEHKRFRTVMLPWDNTPRYGNRAMVHINTVGEGYKLWLSQALLDTQRRYEPEEQIVFLHSWNEWCEGTYLEPDSKFGRSLLEQTKEAIDEVRKVLSLSEDPAAREALIKLQLIQQRKDEGAFRVMQAGRMLTGHVYRELERVRQHVGGDPIEFEALRAELKTEADERQRLAEEIVQIKHSASWRLTAPLRRIARLVRGR